MPESSQIGIVTGISTPRKLYAILSNNVKTGTWVKIDAHFLGIVSHIETESRALSRVYNHQEAVEASKIPHLNSRDVSNRIVIDIIGKMDDLISGTMNVPDQVIAPGTTVTLATSSELSLIFDKPDNSQMIVAQLNGAQEVNVGIFVEALSQHLGVFGMSGVGKSNFIAKVLEGIDSLNGTTIVYDFHNDYGGMKSLKNINILKAVINPNFLEAEEFASLLGISKTSTNQRTVLERGFTPKVKNSREFWNTLKTELREHNQVTSDAPPLRRVLQKVETAEKYMKIFDPDCANPLSMLKDGHINIVQLHELSEAQAKIIVNFYLGRILSDRKKCLTHKASIFKKVVVNVIEEAHIYLSDRSGKVKDTISSIAREGRKFGCLLAIASQRPRSLDKVVLSQISSLAILRMVNEEDLRMVAETSEFLSADMIQHVKSLSVGSAILLGAYVPVPAVVDTFRVESKTVGSNLSILESWKSK